MGKDKPINWEEMFNPIINGEAVFTLSLASYKGWVEESGKPND